MSDSERRKHMILQEHENRTLNEIDEAFKSLGPEDLEAYLATVRNYLDEKETGEGKGSDGGT